MNAHRYDPPRYTTTELEEHPVLSQGQADDLHIEENGRRYWLCRVSIEDGVPFDNMVTVERYDERTGRWEEELIYDGDDVDISLAD